MRNRILIITSLLFVASAVAGAVRSQHFLLEATDRQHASTQRVLAWHGNVPAHRPFRHVHCDRQTRELAVREQAIERAIQIAPAMRDRLVDEG